MKFLILLPTQKQILELYRKISCSAIILISALFLSGCANKEVNNINTSSDTQISRTGTIATNSIEKPKQEKEEALSSYTTPILIDEPDRQNNVSVACSELNEKRVEAGETFSFTSTMGPATPEKGYEKADTFNKQGDIIQEYGGGKCQISSTLYNAVLETNGLTVVERHAHSRDVDYVPEGKDAAVAYGSVDFKFRNDNQFPIKIYASSNEKEITIKLVKIYYE